MPKFKEFFTKLKEQGKINNPEYDKWLETVPDSDISDNIVKAIEDNFLTMERAAAHPAIHGKIKAEALDPIDNDLNEFFAFQLKEYLDPLTEQEIAKAGSSYKKTALLKKIVPEIIKKVKATPVTDEDTKKKLKDYETNINELTTKFTQAEKDYNDKLKADREQNETKYNDFVLNTELESLGNKFTLAEAFEETRPAITEVIMTKIKADNALKLGEKKNGHHSIIVNDEHGMPKFNGNTPITAESLLEESYKPFLKKSEGQQQENTKSTAKATEQKTTVRAGARTTVV